MSENKCVFFANSCLVICFLYIIINGCLSICGLGHVTASSGGSSHYDLYIGWEWSAVNWGWVVVIIFCSILLMLPWIYSFIDLKKSCKLSSLLPWGINVGGVLYALLNLFLVFFISLILLERATMELYPIYCEDNEIFVNDSFVWTFLQFVLLSIFPIYAFFTIMLFFFRTYSKNTREKMRRK